MSDVSVAVALFAPLNTSAPGGMPSSETGAAAGGGFAALVDAMTAGTGPTAGALDAVPGQTSIALPAEFGADAFAATDGVNVALAELAAAMGTKKPVMVAGKVEPAEPVEAASGTEPSEAETNAALASAIPVPIPVPAPPPVTPVAVVPADATATDPIAAATLPADPSAMLDDLAGIAAPKTSPATAPVAPAPVAAAPKPAPAAPQLPPTSSPVAEAVTSVAGKPEPKTSKPAAPVTPVSSTQAAAAPSAPALPQATAAPTLPEVPAAAIASQPSPGLASTSIDVPSEAEPLAFTAADLPADPAKDAARNLASVSGTPAVPDEARPAQPTVSPSVAAADTAVEQPAPDLSTDAPTLSKVDGTQAPAPQAAEATPRPAAPAPVALAQPLLVNTGAEAGTAALTPADVAVITAALEAAASATVETSTVAQPPAAVAEATVAAAASTQLVAPDLIETALPTSPAEKTAPETDSEAATDDLLATTDDKPARTAPEKPDAAARPPLPVNAGAVAFAARVRGEGEDQRALAQDAVQSVTQQQAQPQSLAAPQTAAAPPSAQSVLNAIPLAMVGVEIARMAKLGETSFQIRLDPPELGRVDVSLELSDKGEARAHLTVERRDTLDLFARDQRALERALREAGFEAKDGSVSVSLRNNGSDQQQQRFAGGNGQDGREPRFIRYPGGEAAETTAAPLPVDIYRPRRDQLLDVRI
ncbi:flagellar hook-length control protein FliK [Chthonobacter albigriseus]|uniref:flagellar hook-length control protein FliK n=1 Tax=Chthonobacter albigriseus TaxID=1683161 RepID=UPI0015EFCCB3|nr:flagellar hook-length control protein FliK [Chthonobacter albigriseus]